MKLIDPDELRKVMYHEAFETDLDMQKWDGGCWIRYKMFEKSIDSVPIIEAEPVRHGRWEYKHFSSEPHCSLCLAEYPIETNYCPNCGAKMEVHDAD